MQFTISGARAVREAVGVFYGNRALLFELARRDITDRYIGQTFGIAWAFGHPVFLMGLYVFIFAVVFQVKLAPSLAFPLDYTVYILSGLVPWLSFQEAMNRSCTAITANAAIVKQLVFPLELLPVKCVISAVFTQLIASSVIIVYVVFSNGALPVTYVALPLLIAMQAIAMSGVAFFLASIGPFFRDVKDIVQLTGVAGLYVMPVFYLPQWVPEIFKPLIYANPFSYMIWCYQDVLYYGRMEHPLAWLVFPVLTVCAFIFGYRIFRRVKVLFGDVL